MRSAVLAVAAAAQLAAAVTPVVRQAASSTAAGNGIATPTPTQANMVSNCNAFYLVASGDSCSGIAASNGITLDNFYSWNPDVGTDCSGLWLGYEVCVGTTDFTPGPTSTGNGISTPLPTQTGMVGNCNTFDLVQSGDTCQKIADNSGVSLDQFLAWNPAVGSDCSGLWLGYEVCVNVVGGSTATVTSKASSTSAGNGIATPTPTQSNMVSNCKTFHLVVSGDTCESVAQEAGVSVATFTSWNPAVGSDCSTLFLGYYVCIATL